MNNILLQEEKKKKAIDKAQAKAKKEDLISRGLCLKCGEYIKPDERSMNYRGYCPTCQMERKRKTERNK